MVRFALFLVAGAVGLLAVIWVAALWREADRAVPPGTVLHATALGVVASRTAGPATGPAIVIVPGTAGWSGFWREVTDHLAARGHRVIAVDLPPFGYSERDPLGRYDRISQAERLSAVLRESGSEPAVVLAHSFGSGAALELALRHPNQLSRLVLVDAALGELDPAATDGGLTRRATLMQPVIAATLTNPWTIGPLSRAMVHRTDAVDRWRDTLRQPMRRPGTTAAYARWLPALFATNDGALSRRTADLRTLAVPLALIWGEADTVTPIAQGERLAQLTGAPLSRIPDVGHIPHIEDPAAFLATLDAVLEETTP